MYFQLFCKILFEYNPNFQFNKYKLIKKYLFSVLFKSQNIEKVQNKFDILLRSFPIQESISQGRSQIGMYKLIKIITCQFANLMKELLPLDMSAGIFYKIL
ncbi:hypothetical protein pb186bvf_016507 [Paramecium bursaria]